MVKNTKLEASILRKKAEELLKKKTSKSRAQLSEAEMQRLFHELEVHQIELKMQNEELTFANDELKQANELLIASENRYRRLFESAKDGILILDAETGIIADVNPFLIEMLGHSKHQFLNKAIWEIGLFKDIVTNQENFLELHQKEYVRYEDLPLETADGRRINVEFVSNVYSEGKKKVVQTNIRDITERKFAEINLMKQKEEFETIFNLVPAQIWYKDTLNNFIRVNRQACDQTGYTADQIEGHSAEELFPSFAQQYFGDDLDVFVTQKPKFGIIDQFNNANGEIRWARTDRIPVFGNDGKINGLIAFAYDITELKHSEEKLLKLSSAVEQTVDSIIITDRNGIIEYVNHSFEILTGYSFDEAVGKTPRILKSGKLNQKFYKQLWKTILSGNVFIAEILNKKKNGELYYDSRSITPIYDQHKNLTHFVGIGVDITKRILAEKELKLAKEKAEESDRLKSAFLANISHEVRTPLNSILGFSDLLMDSDFSEEQKKRFTQQIIRNGNSLLTIISDIMDISKLVSGEIVGHKIKVDVQQFISSIIEQFLLQTEQNKLELIRTFPVNKGDVFVFADTDRLLQVFSNLIGNAIKFTANGHIEIGYQVKDQMVEFYIKDTGIGIPADYYDKIFERFIQVETESTRKYGGNGLGLAITKSLVELMGGKIWVKSEISKGSTFYFTLPTYNGKME